ncbi:inositol monophosphatase family protein [Sporosarcina sp. CAU 1771]
MDWYAIDRYAKSLIKEAGHKIRVSFFSQIHIDTKSNVNDLVTNIDREIEQFFISRIREDFPKHQIFGEEGFGDKVTSLDGVTWILDPIDGTMNFVHQKRHFAISLGIYVDGVGMLGYIYDVMNDDFYHAVNGGGAYYNDELLPRLDSVTVEKAVIGLNAQWVAPNRYLNNAKIIELVSKCRGTRSYGSAALELAYVSTGRLDAYISTRLSPWDIAGGLVIAKETGLVASNLMGNPLTLLSQDTVLVSRKGLHNDILADYIELT